MKFKQIAFTLILTFILSLLLQGIADPNIFILSNWRINNLISFLHLWITFLSAYYLFSGLLSLGLKRLSIDTRSRLIILLIATQFVVLFWVLVTDILFYIINYDIESLNETTFYDFDLPIALVILTIGSVYFYQRNYSDPIHEKVEENAEINYLEGYSGSKKYLVEPPEVALIFVSEKVVWLLRRDGYKLTTNSTLDNLSEHLSPTDFFRLNRQVIISRSSVKGYKRLDYQKLEVIVSDGIRLNLNLVVSKYNAPLFKKWLTNSA